ncbi:DUF6243 family protein [Streptomyces sp. NBC_01218]|uniref:DUF6243 family protein n=1 Tax=unclassified Streptomyces TaxID=2593676 RepID=UPI0023B906AF|nr:MULTISPECIES: DUF6243 family protein [unclassified Streptomyces]WEH41899.1 DUF6243 family protein [Streptomyces sp. AM 2-1-1]WSQ53511.1 DUF6243 family protein [Streptomyces sp. NBC_01218]
MAKSRNNLLGVGGQRKKLSRADQQGAGTVRDADRKVAEDKKQELVRKMRERATGTAPETDAAATDASVTGADAAEDRS